MPDRHPVDVPDAERAGRHAGRLTPAAPQPTDRPNTTARADASDGDDLPGDDLSGDDLSGDGPADAAVRSRRTFLGWASAAGTAAIAGMLGVPVLRAFVAPALAGPRERPWIKVADDVSALDVGTPIKVDFVEAADDAWVEGRTLRTVWLRTEDGQTFTAFSGVCPHLGCSFFYETEKKLYHCPCHHGLFDGVTGAVVGGPPPRPLDALPVKVDDGALYVQYEAFRTGVPQQIAV